MNWEPWATRIIAVVGVGLGVYNAWVARRRDSVRLKIREECHELSEDWLSLPSYGVRVENAGHLAVTLESIDLRIKRDGQQISIAVWPVYGKEVLTIEARRAINFPLYADVFEEGRCKGVAHIVVRTEAAGTFLKRAPKFWVFAMNYRAVVEHMSRPAATSSIPS